MPRAIQQLLPPTPAKKVTLLPPKPNAATQAHERAEDFRTALKTARQKNEETTQPQPKPAKADAKKTSGKPDAKAAGKTKGKPATKAQDDHSEVDETTEDLQHVSTEVANQAELEAPKPEETPAPEADAKEAHEPEAHADHTEQDAAPADAVAAQLIRPVERAKDERQPKQAKEEKPEALQDVDATHNTDPVPTDPAATAAVPANASTTSAPPPTPPSNAPEAKRPKTDAAPTPSITTTNPTTANATDQVTAAAAAAQATGAAAAATNPQPTNSAPANPPSAQPRPTTPIVSALGVEQAPIQPPAEYATATDRATAPSNVDLPVDPNSTAQDLSAIVEDPTTADAPAHKSADPLDLDLDAAARLATDSPHHPGDTPVQATKLPDAPAPPPEVDFAQNNHDRIVTGVHSQLLPHGGAMEIRLDPPELGALKVMVEMRDGVMNATFQTSNEQATQLLSHSLNQLKHVLESQGVSVERLQVQQAPKNEHTQSDGDRQQQHQQQRDTNDDHAARQEQQRKEMMRRMWRRVSGAGDPIDYMA